MEEKLFEELEKIELPTRKEYEEVLDYLTSLEKRFPEEADKIKKVKEFVKLAEILVG